MTEANLLKNKIKENEYNKMLEALYGDTEQAKERYLNAVESFEKQFGNNRELEIYSAPGRTEIIGNHTDHQCGKAVAGSVNLDIIGIVSMNNDNVIRVKSEGFSRIDVVDLSDLSVDKNEMGYSASLIRGAANKFTELGYKIGGFDMYTTSNVLKGSGLSSSAAFEVLIAVVMNGLFCESKEDAVSMAKIGKYAENVYFGKPCGLLDQTASSVGGFVYMDFCDNENPEVSKIDIDFKKYGYSLCIVDTGGNHAALTDEYASVSNDLKKLCRYFDKEVLRQVDEEEFKSKLDILRKETSDRAILRAFHVFDENRRVEELKNALENGDFDKFLSLSKASGNSSFKYLQNVFSTVDIDEQGLTLALLLTEKFLGDKGAYRVHGGGFAGTIQAFVPNDMVDSYISEMEKVFGKGKCYNLFIRPYGAVKIA